MMGLGKSFGGQSPLWPKAPNSPREPFVKLDGWPETPLAQLKPNPFLPTTRATRIARLVEECGEVLKEVGKAGRFGLDTRWDKKWRRVITVERDGATLAAHTESNREALLRELLDLEGTISELRRDLEQP